MARPGKGPRLDKNPRGLYEIRWTETDATGKARSKRLSTGTASLQEAHQVFAGWLNEYNQDTGQTAPTIGYVLDYYLENRGHKITDLQRQIDAANMVNQGLGDLRVDEVDDAALAKYRRLRMSGAIKGQRRRCTSDATLRRDLNCLKAALNYALKKHLITMDQMPYIELPEGSPPAEFWLTEQEADDLLRFASEQTDDKGRLTRAYRYIALGLATAARMTSILELTWHQVDLRAGLIRYDLSPDGKQIGRRTKKRKVPVPIANWLMPILEQAKRERVSEYVLDEPIQIRRQMDKVCAQAAETLGNSRYKKLNRHALRHTAATHMARAGVDMWQLAGILGDSLQTVQKTYLHHCPDHLRGAVNFRSPDIGQSGQTANDSS
jgi:integrase